MLLKGLYVMGNVTFDKKAMDNTSKEDIEWIRIWCEDTNEKNLPRVALVGDSITEGYYHFVKELLKDVARVDSLATSFSITSKIYSETVKNFIEDSKYDIVHFNYGLHAYNVTENDYYFCCEQLLKFVSLNSKVIVATTTTVYDESLEKNDPVWAEKVDLRNEKITMLAKELNFKINDLKSLCDGFDKSMKNPDGVHFTEDGYKVLAQNVAECVRRLLK